MIVSINDYNNAEKLANDFYHKNKIIKCPALDSIVKMTPSGMEHLKKKDKKHHRSMNDTYVRYKCLLNIKEVLNNMSHYQEYRAGIRKVKVRKQGKTKYENKMSEDIAFIAIIQVGSNKNRIKVVISKIHGNDFFEFRSVIPSRNSKGYTFFENKKIS